MLRLGNQWNNAGFCMHEFPSHSDPESLALALVNETTQFQDYYSWLKRAMPSHFWKEVSSENILLIVHSLMGFHLQEYFSTIHLKSAAIVLCLESPDADLRVLKNYAMYGIKNYETYVSTLPPPFSPLFAGVHSHLRIATLFFTEAFEKEEEAYPDDLKEKLKHLLQNKNPALTDEEFYPFIQKMNARFLRSLPFERLVLACEMLFRAKSRDHCQYEVLQDEKWQETQTPSMQIVLAWRNTPKHNFLYRLARTVHRNGLVMKRVSATYVDPYSKHSILVMVLSLHGSKGEAAWEAAHIPHFLRELVTLKYFASFDPIDAFLVSKGFISGMMGHFLRATVSFVHQILLNVDSHQYNNENIEEALCRHPELTTQVCEAFKAKFDPFSHNETLYENLRNAFLNEVNKLDTGQEDNDLRRKNILLQAMNFVHHTLKTNFYLTNYTALSFRLDPHYLEAVPFDRSKKFPELPFAIFFIKGMHFFAFHIRFKDLSRGGLRTVYPEHSEQMKAERNNVFIECYNLAYTQHMKNKDIPEGGSKGVIFLRPFDRLESESHIFSKELQVAQIEPEEIEEKISLFIAEQKMEYLYQAQRSFIESLMTLINCHPDGKLCAKNSVDYWNRPEYLYLGPDENMHDSMIQWIADYSLKFHYKPGSCFISSKPALGINHKEYGVTSLGINVYMTLLLIYLGIDPSRENFTVKMTGGPDGDVAGNQLLNLYRYYPHTAKLIALTDGSGTINDPKGLDLKILVDLFHEGKAIRHYPAGRLNEGGFLVDKQTMREQTALSKQTLCLRKVKEGVVEEWLSGSEMNQLIRNNVHHTKADIFIPAGGRPRTLNESNYLDFIDETGKPTARGIIEGANLYLTPAARRKLEERGTLIIKDSSANKTGVICSSFEVLSGLTLGDEAFIIHKETLVKEILEHLKECATQEAHLILRTHKENGGYLTDISDKTSQRINQFTYQILDYLDNQPLSNLPEDPLVRVFLNYCPPFLKNHFENQLLREIPDHHKKAIIACHISTQLVYMKGLSWFPSIVDILPLILQKNSLM